MGATAPLKTWDKEVKFEVKPDYAIVQVRYGGGRGSGFFLNETESCYIDELKERCPELYENLKNEIMKLNRLFS